MNIREEIGKPGFAMGLVAFVITFPAMIFVVVLCIAGPGNILHHRWHDAMVDTACFAAAWVVVFGGKYLWKRGQKARV